MQKTIDIVLDVKPTGQDHWTRVFSTIDGLSFMADIKHYDTPSQFGIDGGKISKMQLSSGANPYVAAYDRGWCKKPNGRRNVAFYQALIERFN